MYVNNKKEAIINMIETINSKRYLLNANKMGIYSIRIIFHKDCGIFEYEKNSKIKRIGFGICKNEFGLFPEDGYSDLIGGKESENYFYRYAASASWIEENKLHIKIQIIDKYFGQLNIFIGFKNNGVGLYMNKAAENFLKDYQGYAGGVEENV